MPPSPVPDLRARELQTIVALAEYGSFVAAASHLKMSQPALTRTVKRVERVLGVTLFARNTRRVEITAAGREFVAVAERVLNDLQLSVRSLDDLTHEQRGRVTVSTYSAFAAHTMPHLVRRFRETRPLIAVKIREGRQSDIVEDVRSGIADFGVGYVDTLPDTHDGVLLRHEPLYALIPTSHPLAQRRRPQLRLAALRDQPMVSGPSETYLRRLIDGAAAAAGFALDYAVVVDRLLSVAHHVCAGVGIAVLPAGCLPLMQWGEGFHAARLTGPRLSVAVGLITLRGRYQTPAAAGMMALARQQVRIAK
jgi:DNA-binding transcriptional LysR family regulator